MALPDLPHLLERQLCPGISGPGNVPRKLPSLFSVAIFAICFRCTKPKVIQFDTAGVVAFVAYEQAVWYGAKRLYVNQAMHSPVFSYAVSSIYVCDGITILVSVAFPNEAITTRHGVLRNALIKCFLCHARTLSRQ